MIDKSISNKQIRALVVSTVIGVGILTLPNRLALIVNTDGYIPIIISGLLVIPIVIIINKIFDLYPHKDFFQIGYETLGKGIFIIFLLVFLAHHIILMAFLSRNLAELIRAFLLEITPTEVIVLGFILINVYIAKEEINIFARFAYHIYPIIIISIIFLTIISLPGLDYSNLLPVLQTSISKYPEAIKTAFFSFIGYEILLFSIPYCEDKNKVLKSSLTGIIIVIGMYTLIYLLTLTEYGVDGLKRQIYPSLSVVKEIDLPGLFIENLDGAAMAVWIPIIYATMAPAYYSSGKILSNIFKTKSHKIFIYLLAPIIYLLAMLPRNILELNNTMGDVINYLGFISIVILPILIYIVGLVKTRRKR